jgi:hypothetical protein
MDIFVHALIETIVRSEAELISGELIIEGRLIDASNATLYGVIKNSIEDQFPVVYKPIAGERGGSVPSQQRSRFQLRSNNSVT